MRTCASQWSAFRAEVQLLPAVAAKLFTSRAFVCDLGTTVVTTAILQFYIALHTVASSVHIRWYTRRTKKPLAAPSARVQGLEHPWQVLPELHKNCALLDDIPAFARTAVGNAYGSRMARRVTQSKYSSKTQLGPMNLCLFFGVFRFRIVLLRRLPQFLEESVASSLL